MRSAIDTSAVSAQPPILGVIFASIHLMKGGLTKTVEH